MPNGVEAGGGMLVAAIQFLMILGGAAARLMLDIGGPVLGFEASGRVLPVAAILNSGQFGRQNVRVLSGCTDL